MLPNPQNYPSNLNIRIFLKIKKITKRDNNFKKNISLMIHLLVPSIALSKRIKGKASFRSREMEAMI